MRMLQIILGAGAVVALMGLNVTLADIKNESARSSIGTFSLDIGDGTVMPDVSFSMMGGAGGEEAQATCMMTPGGPAMNVLLELPPLVDPVSEVAYNSPHTTLAPLNSLNSPPATLPYNPYRPSLTGTSNNTNNDGGGGEEDVSVVPAPATLVIVGLGIAGIAVMRRRKLQKEPVA